MRIIFTSDTHGHVFPINYATNSHENSGLFGIAAQMKGEKEKDGNTLVIDGGDSLQGTPLLAYYLSHMDEYELNPMAEGFNAMGLDCYTLGNHDFNFGYEAIRDFAKAMKATLVCANVTDKKGDLGIKKHIVKTLEDGTRVGITGAVTSYVNVWEQKKNLVNFEIADPVAVLKDELAELKGQCDITVCIYHGGFEEDMTTGDKLSESDENQACRIARELDFDIILTGHQHLPIEGIFLDGTFGVQPPDKAMRYCVIDADYVGDSDEKVLKGSTRTSGGWSVVSYLIPVEKEYADFDKIQAENPGLKEMNEKLQVWLDEPIGSLEEEILPEKKLDVALKGSRVAAIFNQVQLELTGADFSCTSLSNEPLGLHKDITVRDVLGIYQFANTEEVKEMTKADLRAALERSAEYYDYDETTGEVKISEAFLQPKVEHYNYDIYAGLWYEFDIRRPVGDRVVVMRKLDGTELSDDETYTLVTSNYRATGTGGYSSIGKAKTIRTYPDEMPDLVIDFVRRNSPVGNICNNKFKCIY
ncbi:2',3'-cyclic-nucleotide 2'-phosphodiesterase / 3'-nucleotidase [Butyrivibrio sp. ob235]|uniref:bifunctional metallophosphatase/5'-nucleotidase n=1 Tax=Butyrivibrio sp. ob235 TaxID=1761780 RepID=UPI0008D83465|nr:bifunctional UDP-sugar hydrolase/5'-nucleotidase [Butyrivibrio sp. ob235]SEL68513.1 2',3'-cyclic-nucleotide 2'-phosphodiesterase / 3'-nucleotidase [Butyrivibrio sp. ob235]